MSYFTLAFDTICPFSLLIEEHSIYQPLDAALLQKLQDTITYLGEILMEKRVCHYLPKNFSLSHPQIHTLMDLVSCIIKPLLTLPSLLPNQVTDLNKCHYLLALFQESPSLSFLSKRKIAPLPLAYTPDQEEQSDRSSNCELALPLPKSVYTYPTPLPSVLPIKLETSPHTDRNNDSDDDAKEMTMIEPLYKEQPQPISPASPDQRTEIPSLASKSTNILSIEKSNSNSLETLKIPSTITNIDDLEDFLTARTAKILKTYPPPAKAFQEKLQPGTSNALTFRELILQDSSNVLTLSNITSSWPTQRIPDHNTIPLITVSYFKNKNKIIVRKTHIHFSGRERYSFLRRIVECLMHSLQHPNLLITPLEQKDSTLLCQNPEPSFDYETLWLLQTLYLVKLIEALIKKHPKNCCLTASWMLFHKLLQNAAFQLLEEAAKTDPSLKITMLPIVPQKKAISSSSRTQASSSKRKSSQSTAVHAKKAKSTYPTTISVNTLAPLFWDTTIIQSLLPKPFILRADAKISMQLLRLQKQTHPHTKEQKLTISFAPYLIYQKNILHCYKNLAANLKILISNPVPIQTDIEQLILPHYDQYQEAHRLLQALFLVKITISTYLIAATTDTPFPSCHMKKLQIWKDNILARLKQLPINLGNNFWHTYAEPPTITPTSSLNYQNICDLTNHDAKSFKWPTITRVNHQTEFISITKCVDFATPCYFIEKTTVSKKKYDTILPLITETIKVLTETNTPLFLQTNASELLLTPHPEFSPITNLRIQALFLLKLLQIKWDQHWKKTYPATAAQMASLVANLKTTCDELIANEPANSAVSTSPVNLCVAEENLLINLPSKSSLSDEELPKISSSKNNQ